MGSNEQILNLQKILFDKVRLKPAIKNDISHEPPIKKLIEHKFTIKIDNLKLHPIRHVVSNTTTNEPILEETDCYVKYTFPTTKYIENMASNDDISINYEFQTYAITANTNQTFESKQVHRLLLNQVTSLNTDLLSKIRHHYKLDARDEASVIFEVWSRTYYPNFREKLVAKGELAVEKLLSIVNNATISLNNRSFVLPLLLAKGDRETIMNDKYIGQLFLTIEYSHETVNYKSKTPCPTLNLPENDFFDKENYHACLSVGILRAHGLQVAFGQNDSSLTNFLDEKSGVYVKFSLNFLNKPQVFHFFNRHKLESSF